jgi:uncharacterized membrane protein YhaH (DUF805 family)
MNPIIEFIMLLALLKYLEITGFAWWAFVMAFCLLCVFTYLLGLALTRLGDKLKEIVSMQKEMKK